ncbi:DUF362 domain-containing protein [Chloroflexota bacterium]
MAKNPGIPTEEKIQGVRDRLSKAREKVDKLVQKKIDPVYYELAGKVAEWAKDSNYIPWILELAMTVDQAKLAVRLPDQYRDPSWGREHLGVTEQFAKEMGLDTETADKHLKHMFDIGFVNPTRNGYQVTRGTQLIDGVHNNRKKNKELPIDDLLDMTWVWCEVEMQYYRDKAISTLKESGKEIVSEGMGMGMIRPRWKAIKDLPGVLPVEDFREVVKTKERFAVLPCRCEQRARGHECGVPEDKCMLFDRGADIWVNRGATGYITLKEILDIYDSFGKYPLVNVGGNTADVKEAGPGCVCHWDCCLAMTNYYTGGSEHKITDWMQKSRFRATVDPENCIGCRVCIDERCQFGACQMKYYPEFGEERAYIDEEKCMGCGCCVETCTVGVRGMKIVEPPDYFLKMGKARDEVVKRGTTETVNVETMIAVVEREKAEKEAKEKK